VHYIQTKQVMMKLIDCRCGRARPRRHAELGRVAVARFDLVAGLFGLSFGEVSALTGAVSGLVGVAGLHQALVWTRVQSRSMQPAGHHA
jgi:uncharacterized membrane protein YuzA (DUF378 family)